MSKTRKPAVPMDAQKARRDVSRAHFLRRPVSSDNPYAHVPIWVPFFVARLIAGWMQPRASARR
ncbi:hypothetical protein [Ancylobacter terrae]|uniref:hypothetical protein n=1 Tax=Ancylobacter sp. sgz301288 TaxID=3342077 RepID=UPI00385A7B42